MAHRRMTRIIAIDGPAGSGKSSVSKEVARRLGFGYLDTGAAYRALAWAWSVGVINELDTNPIKALESFDYSISLDPSNYWVKVGSTDVTAEIRSNQVAERVSEVARIPEVRNFMKILTRKLVEESGFDGVVVEGRDITTVVLPDAQVRLLLTASEAVRLKRRASELTSEDATKVARQVSERDALDLKVIDFMTPADGVALVDSTDLDFEQTVRAVLDLIR